MESVPKVQNTALEIGPSADARYEQAVRSRLQTLRQTLREWTLREVLPQMRGASPELVAHICPELIRSEPSQTEAQIGQEVCGFEPHPLDYDWRFSPETVTQLVERVSGGATTFILMGVPNLFGPLGQYGTNVTLLDRNPACAHATTIDFTAFDPEREARQIPAVGRARVLLDAPWYPGDLVAWINFAIRRFTQIDALFFSLWPQLVRPTAAGERSYILNWLQRFGLVEVLQDYLSYEVPPFEELAYRERGISIDFRWRKGDLVIFKPNRPLETLATPGNPDAKLWKRYLIGRRQIAIQDTPSPPPPKLFPIGNPPTWHFNTVSRRDPRRDKIQFWTSNNVVAQASGSRMIMSALSDFFGAAKPFDVLTTEQQEALKLMSALGCIELHNRQAFVTWQHRE